MDFKKFRELIMVEQTLFALPFAYIGVLFAGGGNIFQWLWVTIALVGARTAGMAFNRVLDAEIDGENPRTENRLVPTGKVSKVSVWILGILSSLFLVGASFMLNQLCFYLSFLAVLFLFVYSLFKRFSASSHLFLGFVEAAAPIGGYLAITGEFHIVTFIPGIAIMFWIAGLDILYALQDVEFDRARGLFSIPAKIGKMAAFRISSLSYSLAFGALIAGGFWINMTSAYWVALLIVTAIFVKQQIIPRGDDGSFEERMIRVFKLNRLISPILFFGLLADILLKPYIQGLYF